jgi:hypothetical protein
MAGTTRQMNQIGSIQTFGKKKEEKKTLSFLVGHVLNTV